MPSIWHRPTLEIARFAPDEVVRALSRTMRGAVTKLLVVLGLIIGVLAVAQPVVSAHASVVQISPEADSVLGSAPTRVSITFNEPVSATGTGIRVFDPSGRQVAGTDAKVVNSELFAEMPPLPDQGSYTVSWKVISADGHLINGAFLFSIGKPTLTQPLEVADSSGLPATVKALKVGGALLSWLGLFNLLALVGFTSRAKVMRSRIHTSLGFVVVGAAVSVAGALLAVDGSVSESVRVTFDTASGKATFASFVVALVLAIVAAIRVRSAERLRGPGRRVVIALGLLTVAVMGMQGHALGLSPLAVSAVLTPLHILAAIIWLAGLVWIELRSRVSTVQELRSDVARRSPYAMVAVAVLTVTGVALFAIRMPVDELISSQYGLLGSAKIVLLAMALVLAWQNRSTMKPVISSGAPRANDPAGSSSGSQMVDSSSGATERSASLAPVSAPPMSDPSPGSDRNFVPGPSGDPGPVVSSVEEVPLESAHRDAVDLRKFKSSLKVETVLVSLALFLGAFLAQTSPPGKSQNPGGGYFGAKKPFGDGQIELTISPGKRGVNEIHVTALDSIGRLREGVDEMKLSFSLPEKDFGPLEPSLQKIASGHSYTFARIPFGGEWKVTASATVNRFQELQTTFDVPISG